MQFWTLEQYQKVIQAITDPELHAIYQTLFWTGMRRGECLALTVGDIDCKEKTISITKTRSRQGGKDVITPPKTEHSIPYRYHARSALCGTANIHQPAVSSCKR